MLSHVTPERLGLVTRWNLFQSNPSIYDLRRFNERIIPFPLVAYKKWLYSCRLGAILPISYPTSTHEIIVHPQDLGLCMIHLCQSNHVLDISHKLISTKPISIRIIVSYGITSSMLGIFCSAN